MNANLVTELRRSWSIIKVLWPRLVEVLMAFTAFFCFCTAIGYMLDGERLLSVLWLIGGLLAGILNKLDNLCLETTISIRNERDIKINVS